MTERYSRTEIDKAINDIYCGDRAIGVMRQLLADRDKLVAHIKAIEYCVFSHDGEFTGESMKALIEEVGE